MGEAHENILIGFEHNPDGTSPFADYWGDRVRMLSTMNGLSLPTKKERYSLDDLLELNDLPTEKQNSPKGR
jgi:hypothetical protein